MRKYILPNTIHVDHINTLKLCESNYELHLKLFTLMYCLCVWFLLQIVVLVAEILVGIVTARQGVTLLRRLDPLKPNSASTNQVRMAADRNFHHP